MQRCGGSLALVLGLPWLCDLRRSPAAVGAPQSDTPGRRLPVGHQELHELRMQVVDPLRCAHGAPQGRVWPVAVGAL